MGAPLRARARYLRAYSRRVRAPVALKRLVQKLRDSELKEREVAKEMRELRAANKELFSKFSRLRARRWMARHRAHRLERESACLRPLKPRFPHS